MPVFAVTTAKSANWDRTREIREQPFFTEHAAFTDELVDRGVIIMGGPVGSDDEEDIALLAVEADDEDAVRSIFDADPWTLHRVFRLKSVRRWLLWLDGRKASRVITASRHIAAAPTRIFELIADPALQPRWDGNDNLAAAGNGQRVRRVGDVFAMRLTNGATRENHVVEFEEARRIAWTPADPGEAPAGHLWRWQLSPAGSAATLVTHTYDWTQLADERRLPRARATTADKLHASLVRLAALAESSPAGQQE